MNEKITSLLEKLQAACKEEKVTLICAMTDKQKVEAVFSGEVESLVILSSAMTKKIEKQVGIPWELLEMLAFQSAKKEKREPDHTFVVDNLQDVADIIKRIQEGEFS